MVMGGVQGRGGEGERCEMGSERWAKPRSYRGLNIMVRGYGFIMRAIRSHRRILSARKNISLSGDSKSRTQVF